MKFGAFILHPARLIVNGYHPLESWAVYAKDVFNCAKWSSWWVGDLAMYGEAQFGDDWLQIIPDGTSLDQVERCLTVSQKYPPADRIPGLHYAHHRSALRIFNPLVRAAALRHAAKHKMTNEEFLDYLERIH